MRCPVGKECKAHRFLHMEQAEEALNSETKSVYTDIEGSFRADLIGLKYFQVFIGEANREKRVS